LTFLLKPDSFNSYNCEFCGSTAPPGEIMQATDLVGERGFNSDLPTTVPENFPAAD